MDVVKGMRLVNVKTKTKRETYLLKKNYHLYSKIFNSNSHYVIQMAILTFKSKTYLL